MIKQRRLPVLLCILSQNRLWQSSDDCIMINFSPKIPFIRLTNVDKQIAKAIFTTKFSFRCFIIAPMLHNHINSTSTWDMISIWEMSLKCKTPNYAQTFFSLGHPVHDFCDFVKIANGLNFIV